jgi:hypothetical protein
MNSAEIGHPERSLKSVAVNVLKYRKLCCDSPQRASLKNVCSRVGFSLEFADGFWGVPYELAAKVVD